MVTMYRLSQYDERAAHFCLRGNVHWRTEESISGAAMFPLLGQHDGGAARRRGGSGRRRPMVISGGEDGGSSTRCCGTWFSYDVIGSHVEAAHQASQGMSGLISMAAAGGMSMVFVFGQDDKLLMVGIQPAMGP